MNRLNKKQTFKLIRSETFKNHTTWNILTNSYGLNDSKNGSVKLQTFSNLITVWKYNQYTPVSPVNKIWVIFVKYPQEKNE